MGLKQAGFNNVSQTENQAWRQCLLAFGRNLNNIIHCEGSFSWVFLFGTLWPLPSTCTSWFHECGFWCSFYRTKEECALGSTLRWLIDETIVKWLALSFHKTINHSESKHAEHQMNYPELLGSFWYVDNLCILVTSKAGGDLPAAFWKYHVTPWKMSREARLRNSTTDHKSPWCMHSCDEDLFFNLCWILMGNGPLCTVKPQQWDCQN